MIEILTDNHFDAIMELFDGAEGEIRIISPFLSDAMAKRLCRFVTEKGLDCTFITRFYVQDMMDRVNSIDALERMTEAGIGVYAVKGLHSKLYLFDREAAVLGSANFTGGGMSSNIELSLLFREEPEIVPRLQAYFDDLLARLRDEGDALVTPDMLAEGRKRCESLWKSSKNASLTVTSHARFGADLGKKAASQPPERDLVHEMFQREETGEDIDPGRNIWLKFIGEANDRVDGADPFPLVRVTLDGEQVYVQNYPWKPASVRDGDEIYLAALTTVSGGKNQPVIMGRGHLRGFRPSNHVDDSWGADYRWMARFPWFCVLEDFQILKTGVGDGIPLDEICMKLGSDTYLASFGKGEDPAAVARKHYQKAHIRLSGKAKRLIDEKLDKKARECGFITQDG